MKPLNKNYSNIFKILEAREETRFKLPDSDLFLVKKDLFTKKAARKTVTNDKCCFYGSNKNVVKRFDA